jgi:hypothetical protein
LRRETRIIVSRVTTPSFSAASAIDVTGVY